MKELKKKSIRNGLIFLIIFCLLGGIMIASTIPTLQNHINGPVAWEDVDFSQDIDDIYVTGTLYFIYDPYAEETEFGMPVAYEYVIDADDTYYIGLRVESEYIEQANALLQASYDYMDEIDDGTELVKYQFTVTGLICEMPEESLEFYHEYLGYDSMPAEQQALFLPYYLEVGRVGSYDFGAAIFMILVGLFLVGLGIYIMVRAITGKQQKAIYDYINNSGSPVLAMSRVEQFLATAQGLYTLKYDENFIGGDLSGLAAFGETDKLVWAYHHTVARKKLFITVSELHYINLVFTDGREQTFSVPKEEAANEILVLLAQLCPRAIIGYSDNLKACYKNNFKEFLDLKYHKPIEDETEYTE